MKKWERRQIQFVNLECNYCNKPFQLRYWAYKSRVKVKSQNNFYCSKDCYFAHAQERKEARKKNIYKPTHCKTCGKKMSGKDYEFWVRDEHRYYSECYNCRTNIRSKKLKYRKMRQRRFLKKWNKMKEEIFNESK